MDEIIYPAAFLAVRAASRTLGLRVRVRGDANIPAAGGAVLVANHVSYLDPFAVSRAAAGRKVRLLALQELFDHRIYGPMMRGLRQIPIPAASGGALIGLRQGVDQGTSCSTARRTRHRRRMPVLLTHERSGA
jgi:1-acyl-sn-glycerol-3-phosphate acyltransferase